MGLFSNKPKLTNEQLFEKYKQDIINANYLIRLELAVGTHGADEIIAGSLLGETGKLIAMNNYGKTIWKETTIQLRNEAFIVHYSGETVFYETIVGFNRGKSGWRGLEFVIQTSNGNWWFRAEPIFAEAVMAVINALKNHYQSQLEEEKKQNEIKEQQEKYDKDMDRLLRAGELYERGLLSKEEFEEFKTNFSKTKHKPPEVNETLKSNFCPECGVEIVDAAQNFCINCGHKLH